jgi:hypothetical protein
MLENKVIQLEFPFLDKLRMQLYAQAQYKDMKSLFILYERDGDFGKEMNFGDFFQNIYIAGGFAKRFHEKHHHTYFYDSPFYQQLSFIKENKGL